MKRNTHGPLNLVDFLISKERDYKHKLKLYEIDNNHHNNSYMSKEILTKVKSIRKIKEKSKIYQAKVKQDLLSFEDRKVNNVKAGINERINKYTSSAREQHERLKLNLISHFKHEQIKHFYRDLSTLKHHKRIYEM